MIIVEPSVELFHVTPNPERVIERAARTCYQSIHRVKECESCHGRKEHRYKDIDGDIQASDCVACNGTGTDIESARKIIKTVIDSGHESVLEHASAGVIIVTDRGITHELVRHRIGVAFSQESTRYCNYSAEKGAFCGEIYVIEPPGLNVDQKPVWSAAMEAAESAYKQLISLGCKPQIARSVLPTSLKAEICTTMTFRAWRHFLDLRTAPAAHPQIQQIAEMVRQKLYELAPSCFEDFHEAH